MRLWMKMCLTVMKIMFYGQKNKLYVNYVTWTCYWQVSKGSPLIQNRFITCLTFTTDLKGQTLLNRQTA